MEPEEKTKPWFPVFEDFYDPLMAGSIDGTDEEPHDRGISRAMCKKYTPNKGVMGEPNCTIFVARLHPSINEEELKRRFMKSGDILNVRVVRDVVTGFSRGYGFIEFATERDVMRAIRDAHYDQDTDMIVEREWERTMKGWIPRRFGGGVGGKKESGQLRFGGSHKPFKKPINLFTQKQRSFSDYNSGPQRNRDYERRDRYSNHSRDSDRRYGGSRRDRRRSRSRSRD